MEEYQKAINAPSLMSSERHRDPHCLWKDDAWLDLDSAFQTTIMPCNHKTLCTDLNPKATGLRGRERKKTGNIEFIIQKPDYDGRSCEKLLWRARSGRIGPRVPQNMVINAEERRV